MVPPLRKIRNPRGSSGKILLLIAVFAYLTVLVIAPLASLVKGLLQEGFIPIWRAIQLSQLANSLMLSLKIAIGVVAIQALFGTLTAWILTRHNFPGKAFLNTLVDIPFAISPVVAGYMLLLLFGRNGLLGPGLEKTFGVKIAFAVPGMFIATLFISLPFMIREMAPVINNLDRDQEHAAATLGASQWEIFWRVIFPSLRMGLVYGMALTFARALGEFGAVLVIGGGVQGKTQTATLFIFHSLEERRYIEAYTASALLGVFSIIVVFLADRLRKREVH